MNIDVTGDTLKLSEKEGVNSGAINYYEIKFEFDAEWDGLTKVAVILEPKEQKVKVVPIIEDEIYVPFLKEGAVYTLGVVGFLIDGDVKTKQISTNLLFFNVRDGAGSIMTKGGDVPPADVWEQYLQTINRLLDETIEARDTTEGYRDETLGLKNETEGLRNETEGLRNETEGLRNETFGIKEDTAEIKNETEELKNTTEEYKDETFGYMGTTKGYRDETLGLKNETEGLRNETFGIKEDTAQIKSETIEFKNTTEEYKDETFGYMGTTKVYRDEAEGFKDDIESLGIDTKADKESVYTKTESDTALNTKADKANTYTKTESDGLLATKVDKVDGKGLSTNDYTAVDKSKVNQLPETIVSIPIRPWALIEDYTVSIEEGIAKYNIIFPAGAKYSEVYIEVANMITVPATTNTITVRIGVVGLEVWRGTMPGKTDTAGIHNPQFSAHVTISPSGLIAANATASKYSYALGGTSFRIPGTGALASSNYSKIDGVYFQVIDYPMASGTRIRVYGR